MPFDLRADFDRARGGLHRAWGYPPFGQKYRTSRTDLVSNFVFYIPLGLLLATRATVRRGAARAPALIATVLVVLATSLTAECLQLFSAGRISSAQDVLMNAAGGTVGGLAGIALGRRAWVWLRRRIRLRWVRRPVSLAGILLLVLLAADAAFPYRPTLDVSEVVRNVRNSRFSLGAGLALHPWHRWVVCRAGVYAVLAVLLAVSSMRHLRPRWLYGAAVAAGFAAAAEPLKVFIVSRCMNVANVLVSACGAAAGGLFGMAMAGRISKRAKVALAVALVAGYVVYLEWTPFAFAWDSEAALAKVPWGAEWLPLYHYAMGAGANDVRLFVRTLVLLATLTHVAGLGWRRLSRGTRWSRACKAALLAGVLGLILEMGQFLLPGRVPSVTDVFCFALGGLIGAAVKPPGSQPGHFRPEPAEP